MKRTHRQLQIIAVLTTALKILWKNKFPLLKISFLPTFIAVMTMAIFNHKLQSTHSDISKTFFNIDKGLFDLLSMYIIETIGFAIASIVVFIATIRFVTKPNKANAHKIRLTDPFCWSPKHSQILAIYIGLLIISLLLIFLNLSVFTLYFSAPNISQDVHYIYTSLAAIGKYHSYSDIATLATAFLGYILFTYLIIPIITAATALIAVEGRATWLQLRTVLQHNYFRILFLILLVDMSTVGLSKIYNKLLDLLGFSSTQFTSLAQESAAQLIWVPFSMLIMVFSAIISFLIYKAVLSPIKH